MLQAIVHLSPKLVLLLKVCKYCWWRLMHCQVLVWEQRHIMAGCRQQLKCDGLAEQCVVQRSSFEIRMSHWVIMKLFLGLSREAGRGLSAP